MIILVINMLSLVKTAQGTQAPNSGEKAGQEADLDANYRGVQLSPGDQTGCREVFIRDRQAKS